MVAVTSRTGRTSAPACAVLFDVDGTLVDSDYLHVHTWQRAFSAVGIAVAAWRIHRCIGMDGSALVLKPVPGARELLRTVRGLGLQVVLATSAPEDVDTAEPEPDIVEVALKRTGWASNGQYSSVTQSGTSKPASANDLRCIGLLSGGVSRGELETAGATDVFEDAEDLHTHLDATRIGALASEVRVGTENG